MNEETKNCQNCRNDFVIESEDFSFYEKIKVSPPTWCPTCRMARRMFIRNERTLYKDTCALCNKNIISMYAPDGGYVAYCTECWWSDKWDPMDYGREYDFSRSFFEQFGNFFKNTPRASLYQVQCVDSEYTNYAVYAKECYLVFGGIHYENVLYSARSSWLINTLDALFSKKDELCYEVVDVMGSSNVFFSQRVEDCSYSYFLFNCKNVNNCFGCVNLRNKSYCIFNEQYTKEEYNKKLKEMNIGSHQSLASIKEKVNKLFLQYPVRHALIKNSINAIGDNIHNSKDCYRCFDLHNGMENCRYSAYLVDSTKDSYDCNHIGENSELMFEVMSAAGNSELICVNRAFDSHNLYYSDDCHSSSNLFGCIGLRNKQYCILNKQYSKEEYEILLPRVIEHMNATPYVDAQGRKHGYGEFFPPALSPFAYNETVAYEYFPLTKEESLRRGFGWKDMEAKKITPDIACADIPDYIGDVDGSIVGKIVECAHQGKCDEQCTGGFKIIKAELDFYKRAGLPIPHFCPNCRHAQRIKQRNPFKLWHRQCECEGQMSKKKGDNQYQNTATHAHGAPPAGGPCPTEFETSYAPERPEIVYCESCYNAEVA